MNEYEDDHLDRSELEFLPTEGSYVCDSCGEDIVIPIDVSQGARQEYVEDCPVCCNPNLIMVDVIDENRIHVSSRAEQDIG